MLKIILLLIVYLYSHVVFSYSCPTLMQKNENAKKMYNILKKNMGLNDFKGCKIKIKLCDEGTYSEDQYIIGEVLIKNASGYEGYVPIMFFDFEKKMYSTNVEDYKNSFNYFLFDHAYEKFYGSLQMWDLRFVFDKDNPEKLKKIELGIYAQNRQLNQNNGNDSRWYVCR